MTALDRAEAFATARRICSDSPLDLGIAHVVDLLQRHGKPLGIRTSEACDGSLGHCYPVPTVGMYGSPGAAWHALAIVLDHGLPVLDLAQVWSVDAHGPDGPPVWELRFRPEVRGGLVTPPMEEWVAECAAVRGRS